MTLLILPLLTAGIAVGGIQNSYAVPNSPPTADPGGPYLGEINIPVSFDGTGSSDPDGDALTFDWDFDDGNFGTGPTPTNTYTTAGEFEVCLTVNDGNGAEDKVCTTATISLPTFILLDNTSGGDCEPGTGDIGKWNDKKKTCKLTDDLVGVSILIEDDDITLNCDGHTLDGDGLGGTGIYIGGQSFVTIKNCDITDYNIGIQLDNSDFNTLQGNNAFLNVEDGIFLEDMSDNNTLQGNTANENGVFGIHLDDAHFNKLSKNTANGNGQGIHLSLSDDNTLNENTTNGNFFGINLRNSDDNTLNENTANGNGIGIRIRTSDNNTLNGNTANGNNFGIVLRLADDNTLNENTANGNPFQGIRLAFSDDNTLIENTANGNGFGIFLFNSDDNTLIENTANDNEEEGIVLSNSPFNTLTGNIANGNNEEGIVLSNSPFNTLTGNLAFKNFSGGLSLDFLSAGNTLKDNEAKNNGDLGFFDDTIGTGTAGTANDYTDNKCVANGSDKDDGSDPDFLCSPQE